MTEKPFYSAMRGSSEGQALWALIGLIAVLCLALAVLGERGESWLRFERTGLSGWQLWRLVTGHFVHLGWAHALGNVAALILLRMLFREVLDVGDWMTVVVTSIFAIDVGLYVASPSVEWYVGLSGALHGIAAAGAVAEALRGIRFGLLLGVIIGIKLLVEQVYGPLPYTAMSVDGAVIVDAHLYGAAGGLIGLGLRRAVSSRFVAPL